MQLPLVNAAITRGCGTRQAHGLYACVPTGQSGLPIEHFVLDPPIAWNGGHFRGARLHQRADGGTDMLIWVGGEHYPFVSDFIEEARMHGISRRVPVSREVAYSVLEAQRSRILLVHPRAIFNGDYKRPECAGATGIKPNYVNQSRDCTHPTERTQEITFCAFAGWGLSSMWSMNGHTVDEADLLAKVTTPSVEYFVRKPLRVQPPHLDQFSAGIFAAFPLSHFEYVNPNGGLTDAAATALGRNTSVTAVTYK